jgi:transposase
MSRIGRKPLGPSLVDRLDGSQRAKERLQVILETIAGQLTIAQACERLGIGEAMFHRLRTEVLEAGLECLEPKTVGRPRRVTTGEQRQLNVMAERIAELETELRMSEVREEIAQILPHVSRQEGTAVKKTTQVKADSLRQRRIARSRRRMKPR